MMVSELKYQPFQWWLVINNNKNQVGTHNGFTNLRAWGRSDCCSTLLSPLAGCTSMFGSSESFDESGNCIDLLEKGAVSNVGSHQSFEVMFFFSRIHLGSVAETVDGG
jgi:hypothetical protein